MYFGLYDTESENEITIIFVTNYNLQEQEMIVTDLYTKPWCPYCGRAKNLLDRKGVAYNEINVASNLKLENEMKIRSQRNTVPQIFVNDVHIGGSDDLMLADKSGLLDSLLSDDTVEADDSQPRAALGN